MRNSHRIFAPWCSAAVSSGRYFVALFTLGAAGAAVAFANTSYWVSPTGTSSTCTSASPCSFATAQSKVRALSKAQNITVFLKDGVYYLPTTSAPSSGTLLFDGTMGDSGQDATHTITWTADTGATPIIRGGLPATTLAGTGWSKGAQNVYSIPLPSNTPNFENLFYYTSSSSTGTRRQRARLQSSVSGSNGYYMSGTSCYSTLTGATVDISLCNLGTYLRVAGTVAPDGFCPTDNANTKCMDRFVYNSSDPIADWSNLYPSNNPGHACSLPTNSYPVGDVELTLFHDWTVDVMRVSCIDTTSHIIYLTGPTNSAGNSDNYGPITHSRYTVDNARDAFLAARNAGQTGVWFLDRSTTPGPTLYYLPESTENPSTDSPGAVIGLTPPVSTQGASLLSASSLQFVTFSNIVFEVDNYVIPAAGFNTDVNSEYTLPVAIDCESCSNVTFQAITVRHTSASGVLIASTPGTHGTPAINDYVKQSAFWDIGSTGVRIGHGWNKNTDLAADVVQSVLVSYNVVQGYGRIFPDGLGISLSNGHDIKFDPNDITDGYHGGLVVCYTGCLPHNVNGYDIVTSNNHIWNTMQGVTSDGGSLYYNVGDDTGSGTNPVTLLSGNQIYYNLVHDTTDAGIIDDAFGTSFGYGGRGIYLDAQTAATDVMGNVVYNVSQDAAWMSKGPAPAKTRIQNKTTSCHTRSLRSYTKSLRGPTI